MNALRHWHETNPSPKPAAPTPRKRDGRVRSGLKAKAIHYGGKVYTSWKEACAATGKTSDAIRWAIKTGAK